MSVLHEPIPIPYFNVARDHDCSDECTIVALNADCSECASNLVSDDGTASTQLSTDVESKSNVKNTRTKVPTGSFIPQHALPWGSKSTNKIAAKWRQRTKEQVKQRELKEASNPWFKTREEIWKKMAVDGKLQQSANAETMFNTKQRVRLIKYALSG